MLDFPRWKVISTLLACALIALFAMPNFVPAGWRDKIPSWLPSRTISLGLDLQGGSHLLLEVDFESYMREHLANTLDQLRAELRKDKVNYEGLRVSGDKMMVKVIGDTDIDAMVRNVDDGLRATKTEAGEYEVAYTDASIKDRKRKLIEQSIEIVNRRVNETGTREPIIQRQGDERVLLQVPGLQDPEQLKRMLGRTAKMTFHLVNEEVDPAELEQGRVPPGTKLLPSDDSERAHDGKPFRYPIFGRVMLSGDMLTNASPTYDQGSAAVAFTFNSIGARRFADITQENVGKRFAIVLDGKVITAPVIRSPILGGSGIITGNFTTESANELAVLLRAGALPAPLKVIEERSVGPSLGADSIASGKKASVLGVLMVMGFILWCYGLFGIFANICLLVNTILILAALSLFQATLTLPGIAGIVLTLGMAVDTNVLIYERIREEIRAGKTAFAAIDAGFRFAYATIIDTHLTTLIAAIFLYYFGTGTVKGFAVTLSIGIASSLFTAVTLTRLIVVVWLKRTRPKTVPI